MADPISISSGLLALVTFALQSSKTLYQTFESFQNNARTIRELKEELKALEVVLQSLQETANQTDSNLSSLKQPLLSCGKACTDLTVVVARCTAHSNGSRTSFRDWARLSYKGKDIAGFRSLMAGYKSTIAIALGDANIRTAIVTTSLLTEYKEMIKNTAADLEELLHGIDDNRKGMSSRFSVNAANDDNLEDDKQSIKEERASIEQCLRICDEVYAHIDEVQAEKLTQTSNLSSDHTASIKFGARTPVRLTTSYTLDSCKRRLGVTSSQLKMDLDDLNKRIMNLSMRDSIFDEHAPGDQGMREELESIKQCLNICTKATEEVAKERIHVFEDVEGAEDVHQIIVATMGDLISAKRVTVGPRSVQWLGQMSDASLQQLSKNRQEEYEELGRNTGLGAHFEGRHGAGRKLE